ncbi:CusA/CzcA family heavy metal efflux RND transporter [Cupriavidus pauculus]|uniref:efflux RND transporter permease subunit n=1 Tax=Cupriavidus pauculus TaxID=82633 RepID=UPI001C932A26|nr:CusA/CzcA family heavy metal efflux RND transporter [Cupriavidus pauculus]MBY4730386.1 CusA/CzcA family heavy metal efflux RND transporter [Cupriavidus pauculus]
MLRNILRLSLTRRPLILLFLLVFACAGLFAYSKLNIEAYPNPAPVILEITAQAPGLSAEEMERYYTVPMEVGLAATPGVESIRSTSFYGLSFVRVTFRYGIDYYFAYTQAALALQQNVSLPNNVQPQIQASSLVGEIYRYQLKGPDHFGLTNLRTLQDWVLQRRLKTVPGVMQVVSWGGTTKEYDVEADLHKLDAYNISLSQMITALGNANINVGGRTINLGQQSVNIRGVGLIESTKDIEQVVLTQSNGVPVQVRDVAKVKVGFTPRLGKSGRDNEDDVVTAVVVMNRTLQTNEVVARVKDEIAKINSDGTLPAGVHIDPYYDRSTLVGVTTHTVLHSLLFGCLLVFFIQLVFLGDLRSAIIVSVNIPFALFFSIMILVLLGESANLLSVGAVDFGIIVDSSVILVENIFRNFQLPAAEQQLLLLSRDGRALGKGLPDRLRMIFVSALQVDKAVFFSAAITVAAFVPLFTMQGVEGQIFGPMARTYGYALLGALIATFTVTPVLCSYLLPKHIEEKETWLVRKLHHLYAPALKWSLGNKRLSVAIGALVLGITVAVMPLLGTEFLPALEEGNLWIRATLPPTVSLEAGISPVARMRKILLSHPEVATVVSQHGRPDDGSDAAGFFNAEFFVPLKPLEEWPAGMTKEKLVAQVQKEFADEFTGISLNFSQYIQDNVEEGLSGVKGANSVKIVGRDLPTLEKLADQVMHEMGQIRGVADLGVFRVLGQPNLNIKVNREAAARYGLNTGDVNAVVQAALGGAQATTVLEGDRKFALTVRMAPEYRGSIDAIRNIKVAYQTSGGSNAYIPLSALADVSLDTGASYIYHERNQRYIPIKFSVRGRDLGGTVAEAQARIARTIKLPEGYHITWAGEFEELEQAKKRLALIVPISIVMIMVLLYGLFNSLRDSVMALAGIPFAIAGGVFALFVTGLDFSISAAIGFISLFGVSVMDGILMITYYNELRQQGQSSEKAMSQAAQQRMRPMLMTALSACIGLFPAALSTGIGSQVQKPLATVVVGGMLIGPLMLLVIVPALRLIFVGGDARHGA